MTRRRVLHALGAAALVLVLAALPGCFHCWADPPCGDGLCEPGENCSACPEDCACPACFCGNGQCDFLCFEDCDVCSQDCVCPFCLCGDGWCEPTCGEDWSFCPQDCEAPECVCGNGLCEPDCMEDCSWCGDCSDCPQCFCGDGECQSGGPCTETCSACALDCGTCWGPGLHDRFAPGAGMGAEALGGAVADFTPSASFSYSVSCAAALPDAPGGGSTSYSPAITGDDGTAMIALPFGFPFFGVLHVSTYVAANGFLSFIEADGSEPLTDADFYGLPRVAPLATDLGGGTVVVDEYITRVTVTWQGWSDATTGAVVADFQVTLWSVGDVRFAWETGGLGDGVYVGLSDGGGIVGAAVDLVPPGGCP